MKEATREEINSKNEKFQTNTIGDPNHPNCKCCQYSVILLFGWAPEENIGKIKNTPTVEYYCVRNKKFISRKNTNTCMFKCKDKNGKEITQYVKKSTKVTSK